MNDSLDRMIVHYATMVLEWLEEDAKDYKARRPKLVEIFIDTLQALEQNKEQED